MTTSPAILTRGGRTPVSCSTAHSSSRPTIPCSTSRLSSSAKALSTAASNSSQSVTFVTPTDDPARVGLTKTGSPSSCTRAIHVSRVDSASDAPAPTGEGASCQLRHTVRRRATQGATAIPAATSIVFVTCLSIPTAEASTPFPTYGRPSNSSIPWIVPSSPNRPCRIGKTTSTSPSDRSPVASCTRSSRLPTEVGHTIRVPLSMTSGMRAGSSANRDGSSAASTYPPSRVIPIGMTRNCSRSRALRIPPAVAQLIECSLDRPPKRSATVRIICCPFAPGHTVGHKLGGEIPRCQGAREYLSHLVNNGHRPTVRPRKFQTRTHRCQSLRGLSHLVDNVAESVPLPQQAPRRVVSRQRRLTRRDEVAEARKARKGLGPGTVRDREVRHFHQSPRDD